MLCIFSFKDKIEQLLLYVIDNYFITHVKINDDLLVNKLL